MIHTGIKVCSDLPSTINSLIHRKRNFKTTLKHFLPTHSFCYLEEYFGTNINEDIGFYVTTNVSESLIYVTFNFTIVLSCYYYYYCCCC